MRPLLIFISIAIAIQTSAQDVKKQNNLSIGPATFTFNLDRGQSSKQIIYIVNNRDEPYQFNLFLSDFSRDSMGGHIYTDAGTMTQSCAKWVSLSNNFVKVNPHETQQIVLTLTVPDDPKAVEEMKWAMLYVRTVEEKASAQKFGEKATVALNRRASVGLHIYQTPPNITNKEIKMLSFAMADTGNIFVVRSENKGGTQLKCDYVVELTSLTTGEKTALHDSFYPEKIPLFPKQERTVYFSAPPTLNPGKYMALATIDAGDDDVPLEAAQLEVEIKSP